VCARDEAARRTLGQWYTPPAVVELALSLADVSPGRDLSVLDPTCGDGAFLVRARERVVAPARLVGVEIDAQGARSAAARAPEATIRRADLFALAAEDLGTFDAVVGNPPYVRPERLSAAAKALVRRRLRADFPDVPASLLERLTGRGDLAVACVARCLRLARPGGRVALVVSSALLDADYARPLWELVRRVGRVDAIVCAPRERWFADAAVNAVIVAIEIGRARPESVAIARLRRNTARAAAAIRARVELGRGARIREVSAAEPARWAAALRGGDAWAALEARAGAALVPLGELASLRRGITSGANDVFYLPRARAGELEIEPEVLVPLLRAPARQGPARITVEPRATTHVALVLPPEDETMARFPGAARYLEAQAQAAARPTLRHRRPWWALPAAPARLFLSKAYAARFVQQLAPAPMIADQRVYAVTPGEGIDLELLAAALNSTFTALALESLGRASMGEGALEWTVAGARELPVLDPRALDPAQAARVRACFSALTRRAIGDAASERARPDRLALDQAIAAPWPKLAELIDALGAALAEATERRAARARSTRPARAKAAALTGG
jgi:adenine-specific DNA-methyltransferase